MQMSFVEYLCNNTKIFLLYMGINVKFFFDVFGNYGADNLIKSMFLMYHGAKMPCFCLFAVTTVLRICLVFKLAVCAFV